MTTPENVRKETASMLIYANAIQRGKFTFASGLESEVKIEFEEVVKNKLVYRSLLRQLYVLIRNSRVKYDVLAGVIRGGAVIACDLVSGKEGCWIARLGVKRDEERQKLLYGDILKGMKVFVIDDVFTKGTSVAECINDIEKEGGEVTGIASVFSWGLVDCIKGHKVDSLTDCKTLIPILERRPGFVDIAETLRRWQDSAKPTV